MNYLFEDDNFTTDLKSLKPMLDDKILQKKDDSVSTKKDRNIYQSSRNHVWSIIRWQN